MDQGNCTNHTETYIYPYIQVANDNREELKEFCGESWQRILPFVKPGEYLIKNENNTISAFLKQHFEYVFERVIE